MEAKFGDSDL